MYALVCGVCDMWYVCGVVCVGCVCVVCGVCLCGGVYVCVCVCVCVKHSPKHQIFLFISLWLIISLVVVDLLCKLLKGHQLQNVVMA